MKTEETRGKTNSELEFDLANIKKELFGLRFKAATDAGTNPARIRQLRREIARIQTIVHERSLKIRGQEPR
ncbi:MAG: 50S ribosomal protein L29 [Planctomycetes bacterium]|jgi:large subunit ribosomal protein L29|nr:50S ribosomal protein L29 [Planctomycetota bacterium]